MDKSIIVDIIKKSMSNKNIMVDENSRLIEDLGFCSFDMMVLIALLEENNLKVDVSRISDNITIKDLFDIIGNEDLNNG